MLIRSEYYNGRDTPIITRVVENCVMLPQMQLQVASLKRLLGCNYGVVYDSFIATEGQAMCPSY